MQVRLPSVIHRARNSVAGDRHGAQDAQGGSSSLRGVRLSHEAANRSMLRTESRGSWSQPGSYLMSSKVPPPCPQSLTCAQLRRDRRRFLTIQTLHGLLRTRKSNVARMSRVTPIDLHDSVEVHDNDVGYQGAVHLSSEPDLHLRSFGTSVA